MTIKNTKEYVEKTQGEIIDDVLDGLEMMGARASGIRQAVDAIEKKKIVRKMINPEVENKFVIMAYTDEDESPSDGTFYAKGEDLSARPMMKTRLLTFLEECRASLDEYIHSLQSISEERGNK